MKLIVVTSEQLLYNENRGIETVLQCGADYLHLRKPKATEGELSELLQTIPVALHSRIVLHDHHQLIERFPLIGGIHLNRRNPNAPSSFNGRISRSCHSLEELAEEKYNFAYSFLSPIFNSISKEGYTASFSRKQLEEAQDKEIINQSTVALGGITPERIKELESLGFGGVALLGYIWNDPTMEKIKERLQTIRSTME